MAGLRPTTQHPRIRLHQTAINTAGHLSESNPCNKSQRCRISIALASRSTTIPTSVTMLASRSIAPYGLGPLDPAVRRRAKQ